MNPFDLILINPFLNLLVFFYKILEAVSIPGALGFAIILLTVAIRMVLWPLTTAQLKSTQKMAALKPHLDRIKSEFGHDKVRHQQEISKLYKDQGVNPLAGCLPLLLQIQIVEFEKDGVLEGLNQRLLPSLHLDKVPDPSFLGFNLADKPNQWQQIGVFVLLIPVITGALQFIQSKMMMPEVKKNLPAKKEAKAGAMAKYFPKKSDK
jgi:YidC/Oxa1 family membrane protein insertase